MLINQVHAHNLDSFRGRHRTLGFMGGCAIQLRYIKRDVNVNCKMMYVRSRDKTEEPNGSEWGEMMVDMPSTMNRSYQKLVHTVMAFISYNSIYTLVLEVRGPYLCIEM